jgi:hypothetical protein
MAYDDPPSFPDDPEIRPADSPGPLSGWPAAGLMLLPLISMGIGVAYLGGAARSLGDAPDEPPPRDGLTVDAWLGSRQLPDGGVLMASLTRLHGDPVVQLCDSEQLSSRLGLDSGEPWKLELCWEAADPNAGALRCEAPLVRDSAGASLVAFPAPQAPGPQGVLDPLRVLLAAPRVLDAGEIDSVILWGEEPLDVVRMEGFGTELQLRRETLHAPAQGSLLASLETDQVLRRQVDQIISNMAAGSGNGAEIDGH